MSLRDELSRWHRIAECRETAVSDCRLTPPTRDHVSHRDFSGMYQVGGSVTSFSVTMDRLRCLMMSAIWL
jgi:hypothetical protein